MDYFSCPLTNSGFQGMFGTVDDLSDNVHRFEGLSDNCLCNPAVEGKRLFLTRHLHFSEKLSQFFQCQYRLRLACFSQDQCYCRDLIAEGQIVLADVSTEYLSDLLHASVDRLFTELSQHRPALAKLHQPDSKGNSLLKGPLGFAHEQV